MNTQIYDVLPGRPYGRGTVDGTISGDPCSRARCSGTSGSTTLTVGTGNERSGSFANGDLVLIHQTRGSDTTNWEVNRIVGGATTDTFTLQNALGRTYTSQTGSQSAQQAQVVKIAEYFNATMNSFSGVGWRASENYNSYGWGGIIAIAVSLELTISGTPNLNGASGFASTIDHSIASIPAWYTSVIGGGFRQGWNTTDGNNVGNGEGYTGTYASEATAAQGNGAGDQKSGGGHANAGSASAFGSNPGGAVGSADLTQAFFGGGGSGADGPAQDGPASGGNGGGLFFIWARRITVTGGLRVNGGNGGQGSNPGVFHDGGSGAGGGILINCEKGDFGTSLVQAIAGTVRNAGQGSVGRIRINYGAGITGTTNPSASTNQDGFLVVPSGGPQIII